jgi:cyclopropane fatty-acyl-phospholipid synthase-like methyltransferase
MTPPRPRFGPSSTIISAEQTLFRDTFDDIDNYATDPDKYLAVPFVPTEEETVEAMLNLACVGSKDVLYDLGSGDGRILIAAAKNRDTRGVGVDIDPMRIADAMEYAGWAGVEHLVDFIEDDLFTTDVREATVVSLYLLQSINVQLRPSLLSQLRPGARIVSHAFDMGDWKADERLKVGDVNIFKWTVPAPVAGVWEWSRADGKSYRVELEQAYQVVTGRAWLDGEEAHFREAELCGGRLELELQADDAAPIDGFTLTFAKNELQSVVEDEPAD